MTEKTITKRSRFKIAQYIVMAALLAFIIIMLTSGRPSDVSLDEVKEKMNSVPGISELTEKNMGDAASNFSFDMGLVNEGMYKRIDDVMDVRELLILKISDDNDRSAVYESIDKYLDEKTESFNGYGTDQYDLLSHAILEENGEYIFFGVSKDILDWEATFLESIGS